ncbi:D-aminopeptidase [Manganibacter manganicus]|uniref:Aminopeptidase n=1 Tax=Manganibacter manganicus TaxID=1873176 RepID=A0A1V8RK96_9HYPH|nr:D-aminopeptidase [Pseudaminobacter manganicus]OQM73642.1 aminopeptidase [Pseudaminobacter manganicus]
MSATPDLAALERVLAGLPQRFRGPGGVVGVVKDGEVLARQAWGSADLAAGKAMTAALRMPICSISKQFTCAVLLDLVGDPARMDDRVAAFLPLLEGRRPTIAEMCHMQSGLRDYWALTVLHGAHAEGVFSREDAGPLLARMRTTHFEPGSRYSYSNGNFRILSDILENHAGRSLDELYAERIFGPAGMTSAGLSADTSAALDGVTGYEGNEAVGFFPAVNRIYWSGDAGIGASLDDMLAWERHIDATRDDPASLYRRLSTPQTYSDGRPARYGFGLAHEMIGKVAATGHGGALRGFRCQRLYAPAERLSVVVMFNHEADAHEAARLVMQAVLGQDAPPPVSAAKADPAWSGHYLDGENGLVLSVAADRSLIAARYATSVERLAVGEDGVARSASMSLSFDRDVVAVERSGENLRATAARISDHEAVPDISGRYHAPELGGFLTVGAGGGALSGRFEGLLGSGAVHPIYPVGEDVLLLSCQRSMDAPAPGPWTIQVERNPDGKVNGLVVGCWLARNVRYEKVAS